MSNLYVGSITDSRVGRDNCMWSGSMNQLSHLQSTVCLVAAYTQIVNVL